ncbi:type IV pilus modification protein PilV [Quatrionicoccus australiensis]|uniref:type IV pilus modification protein PilV n=1 Tax=Quatrionicoccus australiensis TaxID=138118 RepID=UPI001CFAAB27
MTSALSPSEKRWQSGMSMIEVLVALIILALGALGIAALQTRALKGNESSLQRSQAVMAGTYMLEAMRADSTLRSHAMTCASGGGDTFNKWIEDIGRSVGPNTCGQVNCAANARGTLCTVTIQWNDSRAKGSAAEQVLLSSLL